MTAVAAETAAALDVGATAYVAGTSITAAVDQAAELAADGFACNLGYLAPEAQDADTAGAAVREYGRLAGALADTPPATRLEVDLPHIGLDLGLDFCLGQLAAIAARLPGGRLIQTGAEETHRTDAVIETVLRAREAGLPIRGTVQANLRRSTGDVSRFITAGVPLRLVKGAFAEPPGIAWPFGEPTDLALLRLARTVLQAGTGLTIGTHDQVVQQVVTEAEIEMLLGSRPDVARGLADDGRAVRLYVPYGPDCHAYVKARIAEAQRHAPSAPGRPPRLAPQPGGPCAF